MGVSVERAAGADPSDWAFLGEQGLTEDLLPVVSAAGVEIDPNSKLKSLGKVPSYVAASGKAVGIPGWTRQKTTPRQIARWVADQRLGICIQTRLVRGIDIDIDDPVESGHVLAAIKMVLGDVPVRSRPNSGKCLVGVRVAGGGLTKRILRTRHGAIEFLADGQQFVAFGTHPSGGRYQWAGLEGGFPSLSAAEFEVLWEGLRESFAEGISEAAGRVVNPTIPRSKLDMHGDPLVPWLDENGWVREYERDGRVHVRCPWEHEHTTDTGASGTTYFPAGVGGFAVGHWRCLHAHCAGRGDAEWHAAIGYYAGDFDDLTEGREAGGGGGGEAIDIAAPSAVVPPPAAGAANWPVMTRDKRGRIEATVSNALACVGRADLIGCDLVLDAFKGQVMIHWGGGSWRALTDGDYVDIRCRLEARGFTSAPKELVRDVVGRVAEQFEIDTARVWAESLRWDGVARVDTFFERVAGASSGPYSRAVSAYLWTALAGRAITPGCKTDMVPVLIGGQGTGKTRLVEAIAPEESTFVEVDLSHRDDNLARALRGKLVGELAELRGLTSRDAESIKAWISRRVEEWTPKYVEHVRAYPRRVVLIGTGNVTEFLDDETGERRWLPIKVGKIDVEQVVKERQQLWAEGVARYLAGGVEWENAQNLAAEVHAEHKVGDPWTEIIAGWLDRADSRGEGVALLDVALGALGIEPRLVGRREELRIGKILRKLGFVKINVRVDGGVGKRWRRAMGSQMGNEKAQ